MVETTGAALPLTTKLVDKNGSVTNVADAELRMRFAAFVDSVFPEGLTIVTENPDFSPAEAWGGCWEYDETNHGLAGEYRYVKIAEPDEDLNAEGGQDASA